MPGEYERDLFLYMAKLAALKKSLRLQVFTGEL